MINRTVSDSRLSLIKDPRAEDLWLINCSATNLTDDARPHDLFGSDLKLFIEQRIHVIDWEGEKKCRTLTYTYRLQDDAQNILIRWEYNREPPKDDYRYPLAHVHFHGALTHSEGDMSGVHVATGRVPLEAILRHLIADWGVNPRDGATWEQILDDSTAGFHERRTDTQPPAIED